MELSWAALSHRGLVREHNEDAVLAAAPVFVVADGMGGHLAGEVASELTIDHFRTFVGAPALSIREVSQAIEAANEAVVAVGESQESRSGMGTTVVGLVAVEQTGRPYWLAFNVGDSRLYRLYRGELSQVSVDHSYVQELINTGRLSADDAMAHPERNVVTRALGHETVVDPDFWLMPPEAGERFLLCSDGLSGDVPGERIHRVLEEIGDPADAVAELVAAALGAGGHDNISVVVVDVRAVPDYTAHEHTAPREAVPHE